MPLRSRLKEFYKTWLEPPGLRELRTRPPEQGLQKFWNGEDVPLPPREAAFAKSVGVEGKSITRRDETRPCLLIKSKATLPVVDGAGARFVQVGLMADAWRQDSTVRLSAGGVEVQHTRLKPGRWLDVRLELPVGGATELEVVSDQPLWVSVPRTVHNAAGDDPRHVLVLVLDGMARRVVEAMEASSPDGPTTPNIERFFAEGYHAPFGFSASDWTLPTTSSFFTGQLPSQHGMVHPRLEMHHRTDRPLLAERFQEAGYHTLLMSCGNRLTPAFDVHRGVDRFVYHWPYEGKTTFDYRPEVWISEILGHLATHRDDRTYTYAHFPDTHPAWNLPPLTRAFNLGRSGDSSGHDLDHLEGGSTSRAQGLQLLRLRLRELDRLLGGLFDWIDRELADDTLVVLTADHGSPWLGFPDPLTGPKINLSEFRTGIEFRMRGAGVPQKVEERVVCPNLDLLPTLSGLMGWARSDDVDGVDLLDPSANREHCITECLYTTEYEIAVNDGQGQWIEKYPMDEETNRVTGPATWKGWFPLGSMSFGEPLRDHDPYREAIVQQHLSSRGILA